MKLVFANYVLDTNRRELRLGFDPVAVEPQVFDVLLYLVQNRDRLVSKDDLIASVWGGRIVSDSNVSQSQLHLLAHSTASRTVRVSSQLHSSAEYA